MSCWFGACASARCCCSLHCSFCTYAPRVCWAVGPRAGAAAGCGHSAVFAVCTRLLYGYRHRAHSHCHIVLLAAPARGPTGGAAGRGPLAAVFVLGVLGTLLKVTVVIMVIAVVLDWMISFPKLRERLAALALLAAVVAGVNAGSLAAAHSGAFRKAQPGDEIPKTHWIMMGLAGNGGYQQPRIMC